MLRGRSFRRSYSWSPARAVWLLLAAVETLIGLRVLLVFLAADPASGFMQFILDITGPLVRPFAGIFANRAVAGGVLEIASLVAMLVYWLAAWLLIRLLVSLSAPRRRLMV